MTRWPKPKPTVVRRREQRAADEQQRRAVRVAVWRRDGGRCRVCGGRGADLHHLVPRSRGGRWTRTNCLVLCRACHQDVHAHVLVIETTTANRRGPVVSHRRRWW